MAAQTDVTIVNNDNSKKFLFRGVSFKNRKFQPSIDVPIVNATAANRVIFRFTGQSQDLTFSFALFDDDTDVSDGTAAPAQVKTVDQQIQFLMEDFFTENFDVDWTMTQSRHFLSPIIGVIDNIDIEDNAGSGTVVVGTLTFKRGRIGAL